MVPGQGCERAVLRTELDAAAEARDTGFPGALLLKDGPPDPRFSLPNAPGLIARSDLGGRTVIQKTGNGTRGAHAARAAGVVLCASFATAGATAAALRQLGARRVLLMPTEGDEDWALADYLERTIASPAGRPAVGPYLQRVRESEAGRECLTKGGDPAFGGFDVDDLDRCATLDTFDFAIRADPGPGGLLHAHRVAA